MRTALTDADRPTDLDTRFVETMFKLTENFPNSPNALELVNQENEVSADEAWNHLIP
jgi:hypothetical protein